MKPCEACKGTGGRQRDCPVCGGTGILHDVIGHEDQPPKCPMCNGTGKQEKKDVCPWCHGTGQRS